MARFTRQTKRSSTAEFPPHPISAIPLLGRTGFFAATVKKLGTLCRIRTHKSSVIREAVYPLAYEGKIKKRKIALNNLYLLFLVSKNIIVD